MKQVKQIKKLAKIAEKTAARTSNPNDANEHLNLASAFKAQADVLKQKLKRKRKKDKLAGAK